MKKFLSLALILALVLSLGAMNVFAATPRYVPCNKCGGTTIQDREVVRETPTGISSPCTIHAAGSMMQKMEQSVHYRTRCLNCSWVGSWLDIVYEYRFVHNYCFLP